MNNDLTTDEKQRRVADAAANFTVPVAQSYATLLPLKESITMLRRKGASFRAIVDILGTVQVKVSHDTLSRFCREVIDQKPLRKTRRRPFIPPLAHQTESNPPDPPQGTTEPDVPASVKRPKDADTSAPARGRGPRIADPSSI